MKTTIKYTILAALCILIALLASCKKDKGIDDTDEQDGLGPRITMKTSIAAGEKMYLYLDAAQADQANVWVDLNNNKQRDEGENVQQFGYEGNDLNTFIISAETVTVYGKVALLDCGGNQLISLDLSKNTELTQLYCYNNQLTSLDLSKNTVLEELYCGENRLTSLDLSQNTKLIDMFCERNQLTVLDITQNSALKSFECSDNNIESLDLTQNTVLTGLYCNNNKLTSLDLTQNTELMALHCYRNQLNSLDLSKNTKLEQIYCYHNRINQTNMNSLLFSLVDRRVTTPAGDVLVYRPSTGNTTESNWQPTPQLINTVRLQRNWIVRVN